MSSLDLGALRDMQERKTRQDAAVSRGPFISRNAVRKSWFRWLTQMIESDWIGSKSSKSAKAVNSNDASRCHANWPITSTNCSNCCSHDGWIHHASIEQTSGTRNSGGNSSSVARANSSIQQSLHVRRPTSASSPCTKSSCNWCSSLYPFGTIEPEHSKFAADSGRTQRKSSVASAIIGIGGQKSTNE